LKIPIQKLIYQPNQSPGVTIPSLIAALRKVIKTWCFFT